MVRARTASARIISGSFHPVDPGTRRQPYQEERGGLGSREQSHLKRGCLQHEYRHQRESDQGDLGADLTGRGAGQQETEVAHAQQTAGCDRG